MKIFRFAKSSMLTYLLLSLAACTQGTSTATPPVSTQPTEPPDTSPAWTLDDVRLLDAVDSGSPSDDLIAAYTQHTEQGFEVRLDFLSGLPAASVYLALDTQDGGSNVLPDGIQSEVQWDLLAQYSADGAAQLTAANGDTVEAELQVTRAENLNALIFRWDEDPHVRALQVFVLSGETHQELDRSDVIDPAAPHAPAAPLLLAFWDTLPSATPAQALRRWDGAHTGPMGQRHGLKHLLQSAADHGVPLVLLDLKTPASLSALDLLGHTDWLRELENSNIAVLPDASTGPAQAAQIGLERSQQVAAAFGFASTQNLAYTPALPKGSAYMAVFADLPDRTHIFTQNDLRLLPLPSSPYAEPDPSPARLQDARSGLPLADVQRLLETALSEDPADLVVLGGSLPASPLGDSSIAPQAFAYIANHPWIKSLGQQDLLTFPTGGEPPQTAQTCIDYLCTPVTLPLVAYAAPNQQLTSGMTYPEMQSSILLALQDLPESSLRTAAVDAFLRLSAPTPEPYRQALQANYLGQVGYLLRAARWSANPKAVSDCSEDLDWDGQPECILASDQVFSIYELQGARLVFLAARSAENTAQWLGPASQLTVGLSEPLEWRVEQGPASDPDEIPGAFAGDLNVRHQAQTQAGEISFNHPSGEEGKTFSLDKNVLSVSLSTAQPGPAVIPLILAPGARFLPDWSGNYLITSPDASTWSATVEGAGSLTLDITGAEFQAVSFLDSLEWLSQPEDPDRAYPPGHFLPVPLTLLELQPGQPITATFTFD